MASIDETIVQGVREWLIAYGDPDGVLTDYQVISADNKGPRPDPPYLVVSMTSRVSVGVDERIADLDDDDDPQEQGRGYREAMVSVHGFGSGAAQWIDDAVMALPLDSCIATNILNGVSLTAMGSLTDVPVLRDTAIEPHVIQEVQASVLYIGDARAQTPLSKAVISHELGTIPEFDQTITT